MADFPDLFDELERVLLGILGSVQDSGEETIALAISLRSPDVSRKTFAMLSTSEAGGVSAMK